MHQKSLHPMLQGAQEVSHAKLNGELCIKAHWTVKALPMKTPTRMRISKRFSLLSRVHNIYRGEYPTLIYPCRRAYREVMT